MSRFKNIAQVIDELRKIAVMITEIVNYLDMQSNIGCETEATLQEEKRTLG